MNPFALVHDAGLLTLAGVWLGSAMWVYSDARRRVERAGWPGRLFAAALAFPFATPLLYACLRPAEPLADRRERALVRQLRERARDGGERCLVCRTPVEAAFLRCPGCADELRRPCPHCATPLRLHWNACPHCAGVLAHPVPIRLVA